MLRLSKLFMISRRFGNGQWAIGEWSVLGSRGVGGKSVALGNGDQEDWEMANGGGRD